jgi:hypothetical protein
VRGGLSIDGLWGSGGVAIAVTCPLDAGNPIALEFGVSTTIRIRSLSHHRKLFHLRQVKDERRNLRRTAGR